MKVLVVLSLTCLICLDHSSLQLTFQLFITRKYVYIFCVCEYVFVHTCVSNDVCGIIDMHLCTNYICMYVLAHTYTYIYAYKDIHDICT